MNGPAGVRLSSTTHMSGRPRPGTTADPTDHLALPAADPFRAPWPRAVGAHNTRLWAAI
ncbi:hypothetical protein [Streptomyces olivochromogenes]|uniref:hypothetical protein n=1 Tax=Streptomyces olivochromogenes TaxID=1963 RepID=UPI0036C4B0B9